MTDEQIIKAVGICRTQDTCRGCPYHELYTAACVSSLMKDVFDLINRLKAEIARLKRKNTILSKNADTAFQDGLDENRDLFKKEVEPEIRAESIKEFANRAKSKFNDLSFRTKTQRKNISVKTCDDNANWILHEVVPTEIDNLVKEMTEETK